MPTWTQISPTSTYTPAPTGTPIPTWTQISPTSTYVPAPTGTSTPNEPPPGLLPPSPEPEPQDDSTNLTQSLGLDRASRIIFSRRTAQGQWIIEDPEKIAEFAEVLDVELTLVNEKPCDTVFQLDFEIDGKTEALNFFCDEPKDWYRIGGDQSLWQETQGTMPREMLNLISPYLSGEPPPGLPPGPE